MWDKWDRKYLSIGLVAAGVVGFAWFLLLILLHWTEIFKVIQMVNGALYPVYIGMAIAYLLNPLMKKAEKYLFMPLCSKLLPRNKKMQRAISRGCAIFLVIIFAFALIVGLFWMVIPEVVNSIKVLIDQLPGYYSNLNEWIQGIAKTNPDVEKYATSVWTQIYNQVFNWLNNEILPNSTNLIVTLSNGILGAFGALFDVLIGVIFSIYLLASKETFAAQAKKLIHSIFKEKRAKGVLVFFEETNQVFGKFISGKLLDSMIVGVVTFFVLSIFSIPYAMLISVLIGVTNVIPFFGQYIGSIPSAFLVFLDSPVKGVIFSVIIIIIMQLDGNVLSPRILGESIGLNGFWILFSILVFGSLFGLVGMICAVPIFAMIYRVIKRWSASRLKKKQLPEDTSYYFKS